MIKFFLLVLILFFSSLSPVVTPAKAALPTSTPTPTPTAKSSYELFYPIVSGKIEGESLYTLKIFRDNLIEILTFSKEKKVEVKMKTATKRLLEAEKQLEMKKSDFLSRALDKYQENLISSYKMTSQMQENDNYPSLLDVISKETEKYLLVLNQMLKVAGQDDRQKIQQTINSTNDIQKKVEKELIGN